jgi:enamine deaminase RidA (YjgF/YER057c/UK114 family)
MQLITKTGSNARLSRVVVHNGTVYLSGQTSQSTGDVQEQAVDIFVKIDQLLLDAGSDRTKLLWAQIWLTDMGDFDAMNQVWEQWLEGTQPPVRACVQSVLATSDYKIEVQVIAAL